MSGPALPFAFVTLDDWLNKPFERAIAELNCLGYQKRRETLRGMLILRDVRVLPLLLAIMRQPEEHLRRDLIDCLEYGPVEPFIVGLRHHARMEHEASGVAARQLLLRLQISPITPNHDADPAAAGAARTSKLLAALESKDESWRAIAAEELGTYETDRGVQDALFRAARHDPAIMVQWRARHAAVEVLKRRVGEYEWSRRMGRPQGDLETEIADVLDLVTVGGCWYSIPCPRTNTGRWRLQELPEQYGSKLVPLLLRHLGETDQPFVANAIVECLENMLEFRDPSWIVPLVRALHVKGAWGGNIAVLLEPFGQAGVNALLDELQRQPDAYEIARLLVFRGRTEGLTALLARLPQHAQRLVDGDYDPAEGPNGCRWYLSQGAERLPGGDQNATEIEDALVTLLTSRVADIADAQLEQLARVSDVHILAGGDCIFYLGVSFYRVRRIACGELDRRASKQRRND